MSTISKTTFTFTVLQPVTLTRAIALLDERQGR